MTDIIQWARTADLTPAIAALVWPDPSYMYLERVPNAWLSETEIENGLRLEKLNPTEAWNRWERGRHDLNSQGHGVSPAAITQRDEAHIHRLTENEVDCAGVLDPGNHDRCAD